MAKLATGTLALVSDWLGDTHQVEVVHHEKCSYGFVTYWVRYNDRDGLYSFNYDQLQPIGSTGAE